METQLSNSSHNPITGDVVIYPWVCPHCQNGTRAGEPCRSCDGRGLTDDSSTPPDQRQAAPRPPAVMASPCSDCRYQPEHAQPAEPFWCHQGMPTGANGVLSPAAWCAGMPLGYQLCERWWDDITTSEAAEERRDV